RVGWENGTIRTGGPATCQAVAVANQRSRENRAPRETDCGNIGSAEPFGPWRRPMSTSLFWTEMMIELHEVKVYGMSGRNKQRKYGTTRGVTWRCRTGEDTHT